MVISCLSVLRVFKKMFGRKNPNRWIDVLQRRRNETLPLLLHQPLRSENASFIVLLLRLARVG